MNGARASASLNLPDLPTPTEAVVRVPRQRRRVALLDSEFTPGLFRRNLARARDPKQGPRESVPSFHKSRRGSHKPRGVRCGTQPGGHDRVQSSHAPLRRGIGWRIENIPVYLSGTRKMPSKHKLDRHWICGARDSRRREAWLDYLREHGVPHSREDSPSVRRLDYQRPLVGSR